MMMKTNNLLYKAGLLSCSLLLSFTSCDPKDDGPSIDDYFLNYEIPTVNPSVDIPVGALYYNVGRTGITDERYDRLTGEYVADGKTPQLCPKVRPVLGHYKMDTNSSDMAELVQQHIDWAQQEAGIDFFILPAMRYASGATSTINTGSAAFVNYLSGKSTYSQDKIQWGSMRYALSVMMTDFSSGLSADVRIDDDTDEEGVSARCEKMYDFFVELAYTFIQDNELYYQVDGKPMLLLWNAHTLFAKDSKKVYDTIRQRVKDATGVELYLVARQQQWSPPARYHNFFMTGGVDAVYMDNMLNQMDWARSYMYPQYINENYKYNREYDLANYNVDFIPSISPAYNAWMWNGTDRYNLPIQMHDEEYFRDMCNVAKLNLGKHPMVIIDSFNQWDTDSAVEPSDPYYGNGYGMKYLNIIKEEFKLK